MTRLGGLAALLLAALGAGRATAAPSLDRAVDLHRAGRLEEAVTLYLEVAAGAAASGEVASARSNACAALNDLGRFPEALEQCRAAEEIRRRSGGPPLADTLNNLAGALDSLGRGTEAEAAYREALELYRAAGRNADQALVLSNLAALALGRGELGRALGWVDDAERLARASAAESWAEAEIAAARLNRAVALERLGAYREALAELRAAPPAALSDPRDLALRALNVAVLLRNLGDPWRALDELDRAEALLAPVGDRSTLATVAIVRGLVRLLQLEDAAGARADFVVALALARAAGDRIEEGRALLGLGRAELAAGDLAAAETTLARALELATATGAAETRWSALAESSRVAARGGRPEDLARALDRARAALAAIEDVGGGLASAALREGLITDQRSVYALAVDLLAARGEAVEALAVSERARARELLEATGGGAGALPLAAVELAALAAGGGETLVFFAGESRLWRFRRGRGGWTVEATGEAAALLGDAIGAHARLAAGLAPEPERMRRLAVLLPPDLRGGELRIVPDGALFYLPFELLPVRRETLLVDVAAVSYAPSLSALARRAPAASGGRRWDLVALADPTLALDAGPRSGAALLADRFQLPPLPGARREAERLAERWGGRVTLAVGAAASERELVERTREGVRLLLVGAHTLVDERLPGGAAIFLAPGGGEDGAVTPGELAARPLAADLVLLTGCRTALAGARAGRSLATLSDALLGAGARGVVASLWDVEDRAAEALVDGLSWELARGAPPAEALARAKRRLARDPRWRGRLDWSAFVLVGAPPDLGRRRSVWPWALAAAAAVAAAGALLRRPRRTAEPVVPPSAPAGGGS